MNRSAGLSVGTQQRGAPKCHAFLQRAGAFCSFRPPHPRTCGTVVFATSSMRFLQKHDHVAFDGAALHLGVGEQRLADGHGSLSAPRIDDEEGGASLLQRGQGELDDARRERGAASPPTTRPKPIGCGTPSSTTASLRASADGARTARACRGRSRRVHSATTWPTPTRRRPSGCSRR